VNLPGSGPWAQSGFVGQYGAFIPAADRKMLFTAFSAKAQTLPAFLKLFRSGGQIPEREETAADNPFFTTKTAPPELEYGAGDRHEKQPRIALWCRNIYGDDFDTFVQTCHALNTSGSKDMARDFNQVHKMLATIWAWSARVHSPYYSSTGGNSSTLERTDSAAEQQKLPASVAPAWPVHARCKLDASVYNPILQQHEQFTWYYNSGFKFNGELSSTLKAALVPLAQRLGLGGRQPERFVTNALRFYAVVFENVVWHNRHRESRDYTATTTDALGKPLNYGVVLSKEHRRKLCAALNIPQHDAVWKLLRTAGLIIPLRAKNGRTYSYRGQWRYAQHITTPGAMLAMVAQQLFEAVRTAEHGDQTVKVDPTRFDLLSVELLDFLKIAFDPKPYLLNQDHYNSLPYNSNISNVYYTYHLWHNLCVKSCSGPPPPSSGPP
jgi:hypothetical protein